jgi:hypothetical protein
LATQLFENTINVKLIGFQSTIRVKLIKCLNAIKILQEIAQVRGTVKSSAIQDGGLCARSTTRLELLDCEHHRAT